MIVNMEAFVKRKVFYNKRVFLEKTLPKEGEIQVRVGDLVKPFDILGFTYLSLNSRDLKLPEKSRLLVADGEAVSFDQVLAERKGFIKKDIVRAPIAGLVQVNSVSSISINSPAEKFNLISGIEAKVVKVLDRLSVLLETDAVVVSGVWSCGTECVGEIKIIDNDGSYLKTRDLSVDDAGKVIVYFGYVPDPVLQKARTIGVVGVVCGSIELKEHACPINLLATEGFGPTVMPRSLRNFLSSLNLRTAVISPERKTLIIPGLKEETFPEEGGNPRALELKPGMTVQVLVWPYFGQEATVLETLGPHTFESGIASDAVSVKLIETGEEVKISVVNVLILD